MAAVRKGNAASGWELYIDGVKLSSTQVTTSGTLPNGDMVAAPTPTWRATVGRGPNDNDQKSWRRKIREVRVWNKALSNTDISGTYNSGCGSYLPLSTTTDLNLRVPYNEGEGYNVKEIISGTTVTLTGDNVAIAWERVLNTTSCMESDNTASGLCETYAEVLADDYRYGFNGMEKVDEWEGSGNAYDFGARIYDARLGRWLAVDPKLGDYPYNSPYLAVENNPLCFIDPNGQDGVYIVDEKTKTITFIVRIGIVGEGATDEVAAKIQKACNRRWSKTYKYTGEYAKYKGYKVKFQTEVKVNGFSKEFDEGRANRIEIKKGKGKRSFVYAATASTGIWYIDNDIEGAAPHELGHLLGLADRYVMRCATGPGSGGSQGDCDPISQNPEGVEPTDIMGANAHDETAKPTQAQVNAITSLALKFFLANPARPTGVELGYNKAGAELNDLKPEQKLEDEPQAHDEYGYSPPSSTPQISEDGCF